jgi:threonine/homoserine efflux transporter RhtA
MADKLTNLVMLIAAVAWLAWIVAGGNQGDVTITTYGTTIAMGVAAVAFCIKMIGRAWHGNY